MIATLNIPISTTAVPTYIKQGDTIPAILFSFAATDAIDLTGAIIRMQLYSGYQRVYDVGTVIGGMTITGTKSFQVDRVDKNDFPVGHLVGDLEIKFLSGDTVTYANVTYTIIKDHTK